MMKKIVCLLIAASLFCLFSCSLADTIPGSPNLNNFAMMITETRENAIYVTLSKPVEKIYANWPAEFTLIRLDITEDLHASVPTKGHKSQIGVYQTRKDLNINNTPAPSPTPDPYGHTPYYYFYDDSYNRVATGQDRAFVTLQGNWIVCYNRSGSIVAVAYTATGDLDSIRAVAFSK